MALCKRCQTPLKPNRRFCTNCGEPVPVEAPLPPTEASELRCPQCHEWLKPGRRFCTHCGTAVLPTAQPAPEVAAETSLLTAKPAQPLCAKCHAALKPGKRFCTECGEPVPAEMQQRLEAAPAPATTGVPPRPAERVITGDVFAQRQGFGPRFKALLIDGVLLFGLMVLFGFLLGTTWSPPLIFSGYYLLEVLFGYTPGKRMAGLVVLNEDGTKATVETLRKRWLLKTGITSTSMLLMQVAMAFSVSTILITLLQLPSLLVGLGMLSIFGATRQTFYDKMAKTAVFAKQHPGSVADDAQTIWQELRAASQNVLQYLKTGTGVFDAQGNFSLEGAIKLPFRIIQSRTKTFVRGFLIGTAAHFLIVGLSGGYGDIATFPTNILIPTIGSPLFAPVALTIWSTASALITYFLHRRKAAPTRSPLLARAIWLPLLLNVGWLLLTKSELGADDGGLSEIGSGNYGGGGLAGQSATTGVGTGIGAGIGAGAGESGSGTGGSSAAPSASGGVSSPAASSAAPSSVDSSASLPAGSPSAGSASSAVSSISSALSSSPGSSDSSASSLSSALSSSLSSCLSSSISSSVVSSSSDSSVSSSLSSSLSSTSSSGSSESSSLSSLSSDSSASSSDSSAASDSSASSDSSSLASDSSASSGEVAGSGSSASPSAEGYQMTSLTVVPKITGPGDPNDPRGRTVQVTFTFNATFVNNTGDYLQYRSRFYTSGSGSELMMGQTGLGATEKSSTWSDVLKPGEKVKIDFCIYQTGKEESCMVWTGIVEDVEFKSDDLYPTGLYVTPTVGEPVPNSPFGEVYVTFDTRLTLVNKTGTSVYVTGGLYTRSGVETFEMTTLSAIAEAMTFPRKTQMLAPGASVLIIVCISQPGRNMPPQCLRWRWVVGKPATPPIVSSPSALAAPSSPVRQERSLSSSPSPVTPSPSPERVSSSNSPLLSPSPSSPSPSSPSPSPPSPSPPSPSPSSPSPSSPSPSPPSPSSPSPSPSSPSPPSPSGGSSPSSPGSPAPSSGASSALPDKRWDCGERLHTLDQLINQAMTAMQQKIAERNKLALEQTDIIAKKVDWDLKTMQADLMFMKAEHAMIGKVGWAITKGIGWSLLATAISLFPGTAPFIAAWGIRGWRAYEAGKFVYEYWEMLKKAPDLPKVYELRNAAKKAAKLWSDYLETEIRSYDAKLQQMKTEINQMRTNLDNLWKTREDAYQDCLSRGALPPGTWHRPAPDYDFDSEGNIIGVL